MKRKQPVHVTDEALSILRGHSHKASRSNGRSAQSEPEPDIESESEQTDQKARLHPPAAAPKQKPNVPKAATPKPIGDWKYLLIKGDKGIRALLANAITAFRSAPEWSGVLGFDEFSFCVMTLKPTPWNSQPHRWTDCEDIVAAEWLQRQGIHVSREVAGQAVEVVARLRNFHPVRDYLQALTWDGIPRIDKWLETYLGAPAAQHDYLAAVGSRWLISAIARVMRPGSKADHCIIMEAAQGAGKSSALRELAGDFFADEIADLGTKDSAMQLSGVWILEIAELDAMRGSEVTRIKAFMTRTTDHFRPPYGKRIVNLPRQTVFAGTVNHSSYLRDETGGRRFWPVQCGVIDIKRLARDRNQLWAEALTKYRAGAAWWLDSKTLSQKVTEQQAERYEGDVWDSLITDWCKNKESVSVSEILERCIEKKKDQWSRGDEMRVARCLKANEWERYREYDPRIEWRYRRNKTVEH
jgi:predicted P-loop ATPase